MISVFCLEWDRGGGFSGFLSWMGGLWRVDAWLPIFSCVGMRCLVAGLFRSVFIRSIELLDMFQIEEFSSLEEAFDENMVKDIDHVLIRHYYLKGRRILPHVHPESDEYVIASRGHFRISSQGDEREFDLDGGKVIVVYYPAGKDHALEVLGERLDYFVLRKAI